VPEETTTTETGTDTTVNPAEQTASTDNGGTKTPEWYEKELSRTRNEAAGYRTKLRDTEAQLSGAKSQADVDAAVAELKANNAKLERDLLVATVGEGLPKELRELLKGDTEAELRAHAEVLKKFAPATEDQGPASLQGGLNPSKDSDAFDPEKFASDWRSGRIPRASISGRLQ
jgi:hypothetical protein